jgi:hypothetical protein
MKVTVELSEKEMREVCRATGEKKKGPAIRKMVTDVLRFKRRKQLLKKFVTGEWSVDLEPWQVTRERERQNARKMADLWSK